MKPTELRKALHAQYKKEYIATLPRDTFGSEVRKLPAAHWAYSAINRVPVAKCLAFNFLPSSAETLIISYRIQDTTKRNSETTHCVAFISRKSKDIYPDVRDEDNPAMTPHFFFQGICTSGSIISKDGEYRSNVINWYTFNKVIEDDVTLKALYHDIIKYLTSKLKERKFLLGIDYYFPNAQMKNDYFFEIELIASDQKIAFFMVSWFNYFFHIFKGISVSAMNGKFEYILTKHKSEDMHFFRWLAKTYDSEVLKKLRYISHNNLRNASDVDIFNKSKLGHKMYPLNILELQHPFSILYRPWKEYIISSRLSDLVVNNVAAGFPLVNSWMLVFNSSEKLYDNPDQARKIRNSGKATKIVEILKQAQIHTYHTIQEFQEWDIDGRGQGMVEAQAEERRHEKSTPWYSRDFKRIHEQIQVPVDYAKEHVIMSDTSFCIFSEYLGRTVYDIFTGLRSSNNYKTPMGMLLTEKGSKHFNGLMFELCYNLYCMHSRVGVIHGDLHLSNLTLNPIFYQSGKLQLKKPKLAFHLHDEVYVLDHNFYHLCLIDYSRSILDIDRIDAMEDPSVPRTCPLYENIKHLEEQQFEALLNYLISTKPEYQEQSNYIYNIIKYNYSLMFRILTVLDVYNVSQKLLELLDSQSGVAPASTKLLHRIFTMADKLLVSNMMYILDNNSYTANIEWPMRSIISDVFSAYMYTDAVDVEDIVSVYYYGQELKYSLSKMSQFPRLVGSLPQASAFREKKTYNTLKKELALKKKIRHSYEEQRASSFKVLNELSHKVSM
jgi:hypothetical protein